VDLKFSNSRRKTNFVVDIVSGLPRDPFQWTIVDETFENLAEHSEGAIARFFKAEVLGTYVAPILLDQADVRQLCRGRTVATQHERAR
jgi:hypothetical protein